MRKFFSLIAAVLFAGSMMADSYTIAFKDAGAGQGDSNTSLTSTTVADYVAEGADLVSAVAVSGKVYNGQDGYGLKFGNSSNPGSITLTLAAAVTPTSIVMNASPWSATEGAGLLQDSVYETKSTGAKGTFADFTYEYDGATEVTTIIVGTSTKRGYVKSITINLEGGEIIPPVEEGCNWDEIEFLGNGSGNEAYTNRFKVCAGDSAPTSIVNIQAPAWADEPGIYVTFPSAAFGAISLDEAQYAIDGAGMVLYVSAFLYDAETEVTVVCQDVTYTLTIKNANPETPVIEPINCAAVYNMAKNDVVELLNDVVVTFANGKNVWVKDETASMLIFLPAASEAFSAGDVLSGIAGVVDIYNGVHEVKPSADQVAAIVATAGEAPAAEAVAAVAATDVNKYIVMENVAAEGVFAEGTASNLTINGVTVRNNFKNGYTFEAGKTYNIYGVVTIYSNNPQVYFISAEEVGGEVPPTPADTYTVAGSDAAIFGEAWNPALEANDMVLDNGIYTWEKAELNLTVGMIEFKVVKNHSWDIAYPASNYELSIAEDGEYTITITFDPATEAVAAEAVKQEPLADPTNCAEAAAAALSVSGNNVYYNDSAVYTIEGYVTEIAYAWKNGSMSFWMADAVDGGRVLEAYKCAIAEEADAVLVGDKVAVTGALTKYNTTPEFGAGCTVTLIERPTPINYYVAGSMNGWAANEAYMLTPSNGGEYKGEFTFAAGDEFKVIGFDGENTTWYPGGTNNNFQITEAGDYKIFFNPAGNVEGWYEGYFNVVKKEAPAAISCLDVYQMAKNDVVDLLNDVVVTYANGKNVWVKDETASMLIYLSANTTWNAGDVLSGVAGVVDVYNGIHEIKPSADQVAAVVATPGEAPAPEVVATVTADDVNKYIVMKGVAAEGAFEEGTQSNLTINGITVRNQFKNGYTFEAGKVYNIYGVVTLYNNNPQVYFITAESAEGIDNTNVELKATKAIENGQLIIIKNGVRYDARGNRL